MENWKIILVSVLVAQIGAGAILLGFPNFTPQDDRVIDQYQNEIQDYGKVDVFMIYYDDKDEIVVEDEILYFKEQYPNYEILEYEKSVKVKEDRIYEVLVIYARMKGDEQ